MMNKFYKKYGQIKDVILPPPSEGGEFVSFERERPNENLQKLVREVATTEEGETLQTDKSVDELMEMILPVGDPEEKLSGDMATPPPKKKANNYSPNDLVKLCSIYSKLAVR